MATAPCRVHRESNQAPVGAGRLDIRFSIRHCSAVFKCAVHALTLVLLTTAIGAHWAILQSVAWTTMLAQNLRTDSFSSAVERTFDGEHPCTLCKSIAKAKRAEKKSDSAPQLQKFEFSFSPAGFRFFPPSRFRESELPILSLHSLIHGPLVPPPKPFLG